VFTFGVEKRFFKTLKKRLEKIKETIDELTQKEVKSVFDRKDKENELARLIELKETIRDYKDRDEFIDKASEFVQQLHDDPEAREEITERYLELLSSVIRYEIRLDDEPSEETKDIPITTSKSRSRDDNSDRETFIKAFQRYRGQLLQSIPKPLLEVIDKYIDTWEHLQKYHRRNIESLELKPNGIRKGTSLQMMMQILKETNNPLYYDRCKPIAILYWKWQIPDIGEHEEQILKDYNATQKVYKEKIKGKFRKSNLNIQYRLLKHLEARGIPVHRDDFKLICGRDILIEYDKMWKIMVEESGIEDLLFIPTA
jgi:hypothetical protein